MASSILKHIPCCMITCKSMQTHAKYSNIFFFFLMDSPKNLIDLNTSKESKNRLSSLPLSEYSKGLDSAVKTRYLENIQCVGIDPVLLKGKAFEPDCLPPMESRDILCYLVAETSFYTKAPFKSFRSLEAYNQLVSWFVTSVQGHNICNKFVVYMLAEVRHSQRMNDSFIPVWIITEDTGVILSAHCLGCKAGLGESYIHVACVLYYLEYWTKVNGKWFISWVTTDSLINYFTLNARVCGVRVTRLPVLTRYKRPEKLLLKHGHWLIKF